MSINMNTRCRKMKASVITLSLALVLPGCRHSTPRGATGAQQMTAIGGDPASTVIIVPASAGWFMRAGTNRLPAGISSVQPFPFPAYDQPLVKSVYDRWHGLLKAEPQPAAKGDVVVDFDLHADGSISRVRTLPSSVTPRLEQLCERAVLESAPFPTWKPDMMSEIGAGLRSIRIRFRYDH